MECLAGTKASVPPRSLTVVSFKPSPDAREAGRVFPTPRAERLRRSNALLIPVCPIPLPGPHTKALLVLSVHTLHLAIAWCPIHLPVFMHSPSASWAVHNQRVF